jgi:hypothetical protein
MWITPEPVENARFRTAAAFDHEDWGFELEA